MPWDVLGTFSRHHGRRYPGNSRVSQGILGNPAESWVILGDPGESWGIPGNPRESLGMPGNPGKSRGSFESPAALKKPRFPFLCTHRFMPRRVLTAICNTFAGSSQIKGTPVWTGSLGVLWRVSGVVGGPLGCATPLGVLGCPLGVLLVSLGVLGGPFGHPLGFLREPLEPPGVSRGGLLVSWSVVGSSWRPLGLSWGPFGGIMGEGILEIQGCPKESWRILGNPG